MKIMFSVHFGDSIAHVLRTKYLAQRLAHDGHDVLYAVSKEALPYLAETIRYIKWHDNYQNYGFSRLLPFDELLLRFVNRAKVEYAAFLEFKPDFVIGDMGLVASVYCMDVPLIKILNRFPLDVDDDCCSSFSDKERAILRNQIESLVAESRRRLGIAVPFRFKDFTGGMVLANGAAQLLGDVGPNVVPLGAKFAMTIPAGLTPERSVAFVSMGTGFGVEKETYSKGILEQCSQRFDKVYVSVGRQGRTSYRLPNVEVRDMYEALPQRTGVLICHGGYGAVNLGLAAKIPVLCMPYHVEHYANARRMEVLKAGWNCGKIDGQVFSGLSQCVNVDWDLFNRGLDWMMDAEVRTGEVEIANDEKMYQKVLRMMQA